MTTGIVSTQQQPNAPKHSLKPSTSTNNNMNEEKFKFSKAYPSDHLRCPDLEGKEVTLTIKAWEYPDAKKDVGQDGKTMKGTVILFAESPKRFLANVTNYGTIFDIYGKPENWAGKSITLFPTTTTLGRDKKKPCIRIKNIDPATGKAPTAF